jgi:hypothetical protein
MARKGTDRRWRASRPGGSGSARPIGATSATKPRDPCICGYRSGGIKVYNPGTDREIRRFEIVRDENGKPVIGQWEQITSVEQWQAVTDIIGRNADTTRHDTTRHDTVYRRQVQLPEVSAGGHAAVPVRGEALGDEVGVEQDPQGGGVFQLHVPGVEHRAGVRRHADRRAGHRRVAGAGGHCPGISGRRLSGRPSRSRRCGRARRS